MAELEGRPDVVRVQGIAMPGETVELLVGLGMLDEDLVDDVDEAPAAPSLAAGAIARGLSDAAEAYRRRTLTYLLDLAVEEGPRRALNTATVQD